MWRPSDTNVAHASTIFNRGLTLSEKPQLWLRLLIFFAVCRLGQHPSVTLEALRAGGLAV
jgi:hypothetical protein